MQFTGGGTRTDAACRSARTRDSVLYSGSGADAAWGDGLIEGPEALCLPERQSGAGECSDSGLRRLRYRSARSVVGFDRRSNSPQRLFASRQKRRRMNARVLGRPYNTDSARSLIAPMISCSTRAEREQTKRALCGGAGRWVTCLRRPKGYCPSGLPPSLTRVMLVLRRPPLCKGRWRVSAGGIVVPYGPIPRSAAARRENRQCSGPASRAGSFRPIRRTPVF